jgi:AcrR family transcriptional regulator
MGISERKEREKAERRKTIMNCAKELIVLHGVEGVSMGDIALKAELSKATLYLYFPSKEMLFNEICEEAAKAFIEYSRPWIEAEVSAVERLKSFWLSYLRLFGSSCDMIIIFKVRRFMNPGFPFIPLEEQSGSHYTHIFFDMIKKMIDQGKDEGIFEPALDSVMVTRTFLSLFSYIVENAAKLPGNMQKSPAVIKEMTNVFQIILRGIARDGIDRSILVLPKPEIAGS